MITTDFIMYRMGHSHETFAHHCARTYLKSDERSNGAYECAEGLYFVVLVDKKPHLFYRSLNCRVRRQRYSMTEKYFMRTNMLLERHHWKDTKLYDNYFEKVNGLCWFGSSGHGPIILALTHSQHTVSTFLD